MRGHFLAAGPISADFRPFFGRFRAAPLRHRSGQNPDPYTDSSSGDDELDQPMVLVYRRDKFGNKYRSMEPAVEQASHVQYTWVKDPNSGREYQCSVKPKPSQNKPSQVSTAYVGSHNRGLVDHRVSSNTPGTGHKHGKRSPAPRKNDRTERVPGIIPLDDREGKQVEGKGLTITDWAKNCPVTYAEKVKYDEMNLAVWTWAFVSEILASRTGLVPDMTRGELEARLQHLLCVLQVALIHSDKSDFNSKGWSIASIYAKRIQQKLDRGLDTWDSFARFGHDPHPSEMFAATTEAEYKQQSRKKKDPDQPGKDKKMCTTWNNCTVERKCQYLVDNPQFKKCFRKHECSYCSEKNFGTLNHQRRFCSRRLAAGDE